MHGISMPIPKATVANITLNFEDGEESSERI
jgi:hypothetical protein